MGIFDKGMAKFIACCALLLAVALAAQKDTIQDLGAVKMIQDDSSMGADVVYRLSFRTQFDSDPAKTASKGTFTIKITGTAGNTGDLTLVSHPGYECNAKSDAECQVGGKGRIGPENELESRRCRGDHWRHDHKRCSGNRQLGTCLPEGQHERYGLGTRKWYLLHGHWQGD